MKNRLMIHEVLIEVWGRQKAEEIYNLAYSSYSAVYSKPVFDRDKFLSCIGMSWKELYEFLRSRPDYYTLVDSCLYSTQESITQNDNLNLSEI